MFLILTKSEVINTMMKLLKQKKGPMSLYLSPPALSPPHLPLSVSFSWQSDGNDPNDLF